MCNLRSKNILILIILLLRSSQSIEIIQITDSNFRKEVNQPKFHVLLLYSSSDKQSLLQKTLFSRFLSRDEANGHLKPLRDMIQNSLLHRLRLLLDESLRPDTMDVELEDHLSFGHADIDSNPHISLFIKPVQKTEYFLFYGDARTRTRYLFDDSDFSENLLEMLASSSYIEDTEMRIDVASLMDYGYSCLCQSELKYLEKLNDIFTENGGFDSVQGIPSRVRLEQFGDLQVLRKSLSSKTKRFLTSLMNVEIALVMKNRYKLLKETGFMYLTDTNKCREKNVPLNTLLLVKSRSALKSDNLEDISEILSFFNRESLLILSYDPVFKSRAQYNEKDLLVYVTFEEQKASKDLLEQDRMFSKYRSYEKYKLIKESIESKGVNHLYFTSFHANMCEDQECEHEFSLFENYYSQLKKLQPTKNNAFYEEEFAVFLIKYDSETINTYILPQNYSSELDEKDLIYFIQDVYNGHFRPCVKKLETSRNSEVLDADSLPRFLEQTDTIKCIFYYFKDKANTIMDTFHLDISMMILQMLVERDMGKQNYLRKLKRGGSKSVTHMLIQRERNRDQVRLRGLEPHRVQLDSLGGRGLCPDLLSGLEDPWVQSQAGGLG